jgi:hypothetical protein
VTQMCYNNYYIMKKVDNSDIQNTGEIKYVICKS